MRDVRGTACFPNAEDAFETVRDHVVREATAQKIDEAIRKFVIDGYDHARSIIERNRGAVRLMAEELLQVESLLADEIKTLLERVGARL